MYYCMLGEYLGCLLLHATVEYFGCIHQYATVENLGCVLLHYGRVLQYPAVCASVLAAHYSVLGDTIVQYPAVCTSVLAAHNNILTFILTACQSQTSPCGRADSKSVRSNNTHPPTPPLPRRALAPLPPTSICYVGTRGCPAAGARVWEFPTP